MLIMYQILAMDEQEEQSHHCTFTLVQKEFQYQPFKIQKYPLTKEPFSKY